MIAYGRVSVLVVSGVRIGCKTCGWFRKTLACGTKAFAVILAVAVLSPAHAQVGCTPTTPCLDAPISLGVFPGHVASYATGISGDGSVAIGVSGLVPFFAPGRAFRWTSSRGMQDLGTLPGGINANAAGVSADGTVIAGYYVTASSGRAFRWTNPGGMEDLGVLPGETGSSAAAVSADGLVIVGATGSKAFRWTAQLGMLDLGTIPNGRDAGALGQIETAPSLLVARM